jgi:hypothetical protein
MLSWCYPFTANVQLPNNFIGKEKTPKFKQQISFSSPIFLGQKRTSTLQEHFGGILSF